jgi:hypothetical protein
MGRLTAQDNRTLDGHPVVISHGLAAALRRLTAVLGQQIRLNGTYSRLSVCAQLPGGGWTAHRSLASTGDAAQYAMPSIKLQQWPARSAGRRKRELPGWTILVRMRSRVPAYGQVSTRHSANVAERAQRVKPAPEERLFSTSI